MKVINNGECTEVSTRNEVDAIAEKEGLDVVEIAHDVYRLVNYDKYRYALQQKAKKQRKKPVVTKELQFNCTTAEKDMLRKANAACNWIKAGCLVKVRLKFRGREALRANDYIPKFNAIVSYICENSPIQSKCPPVNTMVLGENDEVRDIVTVIKPNVSPKRS